MNAGIVKLEGDPVAFLYQSIIQGISFPKPANPIFVIVAVLTIAMISDKNGFDVWSSVFNIFTMVIDGIQEQPKDDAFISNVYPGENLFTFHPRLGINDHVSPPAITAADFVTKPVSVPGHFIVE